MLQAVGAVVYRLPVLHGQLGTCTAGCMHGEHMFNIQWLTCPALLLQVISDTVTTSSEAAAADPNNLKGKSSDNRPDGLAVSRQGVIIP